MGKSGNRIVRFQQFEVRDDACAMKVGTDAVLLGSWARVKGAHKIIDLGCGSGIMALMVAQRATQAAVYGVELEENAANQAKQNIANSPWNDRIHVIQESAQAFSKIDIQAGTYDVAISNPPYFHGKPKSPIAARNMARHDDFLPLSELLESVKRLLKDQGSFQLIWPVDRWAQLEAQCARFGFKFEEGLGICGTAEHLPTRVISRWTLNSESDTTAIEQQGHKFEPHQHTIALEATIRQNGSPQLSAEYKSLLKPYVLDWNER